MVVKSIKEEMDFFDWNINWQIIKELLEIVVKEERNIKNRFQI